jgi:hypothetical protein
MKHKIHVFNVIETEFDAEDKGTRRRSKWCYDLWAVSIDEIPMEMLVYSTVVNITMDDYYNIRLSNKGVSKHPDYKEIRTELVRQIKSRYLRGDVRKREEIPK